MNWAIVAITGFLTGCLSALLGIGGGVILVPALIHLLKLEPRMAIGTSLFIIIPTVVWNSLLHLKMGNVAIKYLLLIAPLSLIGGILGVWLVSSLPALILKKIFGIFLLFVGLTMILSK